MPNSTTLHAVGANVGLRDQYLASVKSIQAHAFSKGLNDIDYNFLVDYHGNIYEGRGADVESGAQHVGNPSSRSICYIDNGDGDVPFTVEAQRAIRSLQVGTIHPHRYWNNGGQYDTNCPGDELANWCLTGTSVEEDDMYNDTDRLVAQRTLDVLDQLSLLVKDLHGFMSESRAVNSAGVDTTEPAVRQINRKVTRLANTLAAISAKLGIT